MPIISPASSSSSSTVNQPRYVSVFHDATVRNELSSASPTLPNIHIQLYDEFVSRGNVAVLKCLVSNSIIHSTEPSSSSSSSSSSSNSDNTKSTSNHHQNSYYYYTSFMNAAGNNNNNNLLFEWRIKNGPAAVVVSQQQQTSNSATSSSTSTNHEQQQPPFITIWSNQTQGKWVWLSACLLCISCTKS